MHGVHSSIAHGLEAGPIQRKRALIVIFGSRRCGMKRAKASAVYGVYSYIGGPFSGTLRRVPGVSHTNED